MKKIICTWNGPMSQARPYVESVKRTVEFRRKQAIRAEALQRYAMRSRKMDRSEEKFLREYFGEVK